jgi:hypothetical protein
VIALVQRVSQARVDIAGQTRGAEHNAEHLPHNQERADADQVGHHLGQGWQQPALAQAPPGGGGGGHESRR